MPLYEFECGIHGKFEVLLSRLPDSEAHLCPVVFCAAYCSLVPSRVSMRPDTLWAGHITDHGYITSSSKLARIYKDRHLVELGDRADREAMKKTADEAAKAKDEKFAKDTRAFLNERLSDAGLLNSFGEVIPEATRKISDEPITRIKDDPRLK